jgi:glucose/mannose transport system substrate-binding protein
VSPRWRCRLALGLALGGLALGAAAGCTGEAEPAEPELESSLELFSWWTSGGEAEALDAVLEVFSTIHPEVTITNAAAADPTQARARLAERMRQGEPPDTFQAISGVDLLSWAREGRMAPLDELAEEERWRSVFPPSLLDVLRLDGKLYAVPLNIERDNNLYYSPRALEAAGLHPASTLDELLAQCDALRAEGLVPLAVPAAGWVLALVLFENLLPGMHGGAYYRSYLAGEVTADGPELESSVSALASLLECSDVTDAPSSWSVATEQLGRGEAAYLVMGDWAKGFLEGGVDAAGDPRPPLRAGEDFDVLPGLGTGAQFVFNSAVFGLPERALHERAARELLRVLGSAEGQAAFNPLKGSVAARIDVDASEGDAITARAAADLRAVADDPERLLPGYASLTSFEYQQEVNPALLVFAVGGARAYELDPAGVAPTERSVPRADSAYLLGKLRAAASLLGDSGR